MSVGGRERRFFGYRARGAPYGPDDGTLAPWAAIASLPFAPEVVLPSLAGLVGGHQGLSRHEHPGLAAASSTPHNPTYPGRDGARGWVSPHHYALDHGPIVLAAENHRSGLVWRLMRGCAPLADGLRRLGFAGGWLDARTPDPGRGSRSRRQG